MLIHIKDRTISARYVVSWLIRKEHDGAYELRVYTLDGSIFESRYTDYESADQDAQLVRKGVLAWENRQY